VGRAQSVALTKLGISGIKVSILPPTAEINDKITITDELKQLIKGSKEIETSKKEKNEETPKKKRARKTKDKESNISKVNQEISEAIK
jgi:ribosomal protein S3